MKPNILVIEDDEDNRIGITEVFDYEGIAYVVAQDGRAGVGLAHQLVPDLILCDIMMPDLDGYGVLHDLRDDSLTANCPPFELKRRILKMTVDEIYMNQRRLVHVNSDNQPFKPDVTIPSVNCR